MEELLEKAFDFSIRSIELSKYLEEEKKLFPLGMRLLECTEGICVSLRVSSQLPNNTREHRANAYRLALEAECLLQLMVKTGFLNEKQSGPILTDCRFLIEETRKLLFRNAG